MLPLKAWFDLDNRQYVSEKYFPKVSKISLLIEDKKCSLMKNLYLFKSLFNDSKYSLNNSIWQMKPYYTKYSFYIFNQL